MNNIFGSEEEGGSSISGTTIKYANKNNRLQL